MDAIEEHSAERDKNQGRHKYNRPGAVLKSLYRNAIVVDHNNDDPPGKWVTHTRRGRKKKRWKTSFNLTSATGFEPVRANPTDF